MSAPLPEPFADIGSRAVLDALGDAIVAADARDRILFVNAAAERLLGWPMGELLGRPLTDLMPERFQAAHRAGFDRYLQTREARLVGGRPVRVPALCHGGGEVEVELSLTVHHPAGGEPVFVASLRDLTERVELERQQSVARYLRATRDIATRLGLSEGLISVGDAAPVVLEAVGEALDWDIGTVWEAVGDVMLPVARWSRAGSEAASDALAARMPRFHRGEGLPGRVYELGEPVWIEDVGSDAGFIRASVAAEHDLHTAFAFPIVALGRVRGVVEVLSHETRPVDPGLVAAMAVAGSQVGQFLERERAREEAVAARSHLIAMARALQASLLPPEPPRVDGAEIAAAYHAAAGEGQVGGDFYDVFPLAGGRWGLAIGDVVGRGPEAAALTAMARYALRAAAVAAPTPAAALAVVNDSILVDQARQDRHESFLTAIYAVLEPRPDGIAIRMANAGHPLPVLIRADGRVETDTKPGLLLGVIEGAAFEDNDLFLGVGDAMVVFTDGTFEARGDDGVMFGEDRLHALLGARAGRSAPELVAAVEDAVLAYTTDSRRDDLAIVAIRATGR